MYSHMKHALRQTSQNEQFGKKEGIKGADGQSEYNYGIRGGNGKQGEDGMDAKSINLVLKTNEQYQILISEENLKNDYKLTLGLSQNQINLFSDGGNGGKGGEGGRGNQGMDGIDATRYSCGTSGCNGGDGGNRGNGGNGGNGAAITVTADSQDMDLFMLIEQVSYKGGKLGQGGQGGQGGPGGLGGRGGKSYSWSEECNGQTRYYTNPGGINGFSGKSGKAGQNGLDGKPGRDGSFNYILEGKQYSSRYNLIVDQVCSVCSDDNIIEPGESLVIDRMKVLNNGGMHTPIAQNVGLYLESNQWISFNRMNTVYFDKSLKVYEVFEITKLNPLRFKINDYTQPAIDTTFKSTAVVDYRAVVERVNKEFKTVADKKDNYTVMFPVEISPVQALRSIQQCEESPFVVSIWNRSSKSIGINHNRLLNFRLTQLDNVQKVVFLPKFNDNQDKNNRNSSEWGQKARDQKGYSYDPKSEFLLIFNCETSKTLIDSFKQFAETLGSSVDLWNISNYQGFTFDFISHVGLPFYNLYQNKVVIILSNEFQLINSKRTNAVKQIKEAHIYKGIKDYNMQMHILGPSSNYNQFWLLHPNCDQDNSIGVGNQENQLYNKFTTNLTDKKDFIQIDHDIQAENISPASYINNISFQYNFHTNISCCSNPSNKIIFTESKSILKKIDQLNPQCSHILTYTYNPILLLEGIFSKKYILGQITVIESLRKDCASLIIHSKTYLEQDLNIYDQYNLIKLLSFEKKLYYLKNTMGNVSHAQLIIQAIVSDLCDEYATYQKQSQNTQQLQVTLKMWKYFMEFNIQELFQTHIQPQLLPSCIFSDKQLANLQGQNNEENILIGNQQNNGQQYQHDNPILENKNEINLNEKKRETEINKEKQQQYDNHLYISSISSQGKQQIETSSKIKYYFIDYLISFKAALKKQVSLLQKCCCQATAKVNSHCQTILDVVLLKKMQTSQNIIDQYGEQQTKKYEVIKKQNVFQMYQQPNKLINTNDFVQQNNLGLQSMIYNTRDFPSFNYQLDQSVYIQNDSFMFNDPNSQDTNQDKRLNKINIFENQIYFDQ